MKRSGNEGAQKLHKMGLVYAALSLQRGVGLLCVPEPTNLETLVCKLYKNGDAHGSLQGCLGVGGVVDLQQ